MHFWQLKTFWSENKLCEDDLEQHSFEEISTEPAISADQVCVVCACVCVCMYMCMYVRRDLYRERCIFVPGSISCSL